MVPFRLDLANMSHDQNERTCHCYHPFLLLRNQLRKENGSDDELADFLIDWDDLYRYNSS